MMTSRRHVLGMGGGLIAALSLPHRPARADDAMEIRMTGRSDGAHVWFDPIGIRIEPGQTVRWINRDEGNAHTATAYHPANAGRTRRMPEAAMPWDSGYLLPGDTFSVTLTRPGVYDYYCIPHELAGMVGRIVVGNPGNTGWIDTPGSNVGVPASALRRFPSVEEIVAKGVVRLT